MRREAIVAFVTSGEKIPKRKPEILAHVQQSVPDAKDVTADLAKLVKEATLARVGKTSGHYCGWILPEHEADGNAFFADEEKKAAAAARGGGAPQAHDMRREAIVAFVTSGEKIPKRKPEILAHVQQSVPDTKDVTADLAKLVKEATLTRVGKTSGHYCGWILPKHEIYGIAHMAKEEKANSSEQRRLAKRKAPEGGGLSDGGGGSGGAKPKYPRLSGQAKEAPLLSQLHDRGTKVGDHESGFELQAVPRAFGYAGTPIGFRPQAPTTPNIQTASSSDTLGSAAASRSGTSGSAAGVREQWWACGVCTLRNKPFRAACEACEAPRPLP
jgi:hypothetical protein